jgi:peroxiredoxin
MSDDLFPSGEDERAAVEAGTVGPGVGQRAPDFTAPDTLGGTFTLSDALPASGAVVLYFTMWCPTCDSHMSHMRDALVPRYPNVAFVAVDYVSGSVADARSAQDSHGFGGPEFRVVADLSDAVESLYEGTMGTAVVIGADGVVRLNEDYKDGSRVEEVLAGLP